MTAAEGGSRTGREGESLARISAVLFDLDGTLIDSAGLILASYRHMTRTHLGYDLPDEMLLAAVSKPLDHQLREMADSDRQRQAMKATYREHYLAHQDTLVTAFPGVRASLERLHTRGLRMGVVTSKMRDTALRALEITRLASFFASVVTVADVQKPKPDPEPVRLCLGHLGAVAGESVYVGDAPSDMEAGRGAGMRLAAVTWGTFPREALEPYRPEWWLTETRQIATLGTVEPSWIRSA